MSFQIGTHQGESDRAHGRKTFDFRKSNFVKYVQIIFILSYICYFFIIGNRNFEN